MGFLSVYAYHCVYDLLIVSADYQLIIVSGFCISLHASLIMSCSETNDVCMSSVSLAVACLMSCRAFCLRHIVVHKSSTDVKFLCYSSLSIDFAC